MRLKMEPLHHQSLKTARIIPVPVHTHLLHQKMNEFI
uniref:Uncharacterized protein n=1 Tax=Tetranychus urticae TaxID=32264 RepID=T1K7E2_TETUR